jgi:5'-deoxynucleotidase YfbR-like HD superfamily hydrolase
MTETQERVLASDDFVISELKKLRTLYVLKKEIRYNHKREQQLHTESVAEHVYAMHSLSDYFLALEDPEQKMDHAKVRLMVQYHDIDEIETGDIVTYEKTSEDVAFEQGATERVLKQLPETLQAHIADTLTEYNELTSLEAKFVKAIDKIEPIFHLYDTDGKDLILKMGITKEKHINAKLPYLYDFAFIRRFNEVATERFEAEGFFFKES